MKKKSKKEIIEKISRTAGWLYEKIGDDIVDQLDDLKDQAELQRAQTKIILARHDGHGAFLQRIEQKLDALAEIVQELRHQPYVRHERDDVLPTMDYHEAQRKMINGYAFLAYNTPGDPKSGQVMVKAKRAGDRKDPVETMVIPLPNGVASDIQIGYKQESCSYCPDCDCGLVRA